MKEIESLLKVGCKLLEVLDHENELLESTGLQGIEDLVSQKQKIVQQYEQLLHSLLDSLKKQQITEQHKQELLQMINQMTEKMQENDSKLTITLVSLEKVLDVIVKSYKKKGPPNCYYTKTGFFRRQPTTVSMGSLDAKL